MKLLMGYANQALSNAKSKRKFSLKIEVYHFQISKAKAHFWSLILFFTFRFGPSSYLKSYILVPQLWNIIEKRPFRQVR